MDPSLILPILSYYGTGRQWEHKRGKLTNKPLKTSSRLEGYADCLEDMPNEKRMLKWLKKMMIQEMQSDKPCPEFAAVKEAITRFYAAMTGAMQFNLAAYMIEVTARDGSGSARRCPTKDLSGGSRNTLSLIADIAYRMAVLNPQLGDRVLEETPGILLIDEIELHLHPIQQQRILSDLQAIFPCVQFVVSTYAPSVIGSVRKENLMLLYDSAVAYTPSEEVYGSDSNTVLCSIMGADERVSAVKRAFQAFYAAIDDGQLVRARSILEGLEAQIGSCDPGITAARVMMDLEER